MTEATPPNRSPLDLLLVYLTPSDWGVGQRLRLETIDERLARLPLRPVLRLLALIAHRADRSLTDSRERSALANDLLSGRTRERALVLVKSRRAAIVSSQQALVLALRALVVCDDSDAEPTADLPYELGGLLLALGDHLSEGRGRSTQELLLELVRTGLFYRLNGIGDWYSTTHDVFFKVLPTMTGDHEYIDVAAVVRDQLGIAFDQYWAISATIGIVVMGDGPVQVFPKQIGALPRAVLDRWFAAHTQSVADARVGAEVDLAAGSPWALTTFFSRPILEAIGPDGNYPIRGQLLALKATVVGMHYLVFDLLRAEGGDRHMQWSRFFGRCVETYGRGLLQEMLANPQSISFPDEDRSGAQEPKACDVLIDDRGDIVALDFVHRVLTVATQTSGPASELDDDLGKAIVDKIDQIDATLATVVDQSDVQRMFAVVAMSGPLPMTPLARDRIAELVSARGCTVVDVDERCRPIAVLELHELKMFLRTAAENDLTAADLLDAWLGSSLGANNFRDWLLTQTTIKPGRSQPGDDWEPLVFSIFS